MSFSQYVTMQRVHKAKLLLLTTQASITDIAMEAGFNSSSTFNRVFYQYEKMSPTDFRQSHAKLKTEFAQNKRLEPFFPAPDACFQRLGSSVPFITHGIDLIRKLGQILVGSALIMTDNRH